MFITLIVVMVSECEYVQDHQVLYVKSMQFFCVTYTSIKLIKSKYKLN